MSTLELLASVAEGDYGKLLRIVDMEIGKEYEIRHFKTVKTKYGVRLTVHFTDGAYIFLPPRFSDKIKSQRQVEDLNNTPNHFLVFNGKDDAKGGFLKLNFITKPE